MANDVIVAVFNSTENAHRATSQIASKGISTERVSIVSRHGEEQAQEGYYDDSVVDGAVSGSILGGLGGLLLGVGSVVIPGFGVLAAAGPIAGLITGATFGGIVGALIDLGIPEAEASGYEQDLQSGKIIWTMQCESEYGDEVKQILRENGAEKV